MRKNAVQEIYDLTLICWKVLKCETKSLKSLKCETKSEPEAKVGQLCSKLHQHHISAPAPAKPIFSFILIQFFEGCHFDFSSQLSDGQICQWQCLKSMKKYLITLIVSSITLASGHVTMTSISIYPFHHRGHWPGWWKILSRSINIFFSHNFYVSICVISL